MPDALSENIVHAIISLGDNLFAMKLYWVAISALWLYEYFLTLPDEVEYAWKGDRSPVFWLYILNRYLCPIFIIITLCSYFLGSWTVNVCSRYGFMEAVETLLLSCVAEVFLTLRVYALLEKRKMVLCLSGMIILSQSIVILYALSKSSGGMNSPILLLPPIVMQTNPPIISNIDPYHICIYIPILTVAPLAEAFLCLCLAFDGLAFIGIVYGVSKRTRQIETYRIVSLLEVIKRDGILYFFVLFSSNLIWLLLLLHAPPGLKFIHNQPAMVISAIMINRITLNLKKQSHKNALITWGTGTFQHIVAENAHNIRRSGLRERIEGED